MPDLQPINQKYLAKKNIQRKPGRSFGLIFLVACLTALLFFGTYLNLSLSRGLKSLSDRLGADVMVVPAGYRANLESVLLKGEPSTFYMPEDILTKLEGLPGVEAMTPQLYVATLAASCCSYPVQIIGIDPDSDFLVQPWLGQSLKRQLQAGEAMVGGNIVGESGDQVHFFDQPLEVVGRLEKTGMGFDSTVFVTMETAVDLAKASERHGLNQAAEGEQISCIMVKAKPGIDAAKLASLITDKLSDDGIFAMFAKRIVNTVGANLSHLTKYVAAGLVAVWLIAFVVLAIAFSTTVNERKREMAVLRVLGARLATIRSIFLREAFLLSLYGAITGLALGFVLSLVIGPQLGDSLSIPYQSPGMVQAIKLCLATIIPAILIGPIACLPALSRFSREDPARYLRD